MKPPKAIKRFPKLDRPQNASKTPQEAPESTHSLDRTKDPPNTENAPTGPIQAYSVQENTKTKPLERDQKAISQEAKQSANKDEDQQRTINEEDKTPALTEAIQQAIGAAVGSAIANGQAVTTEEAASRARRSVFQRLKKRWGEIEPVRDELMLAAKKAGMEKSQAQLWAYSEIERMYPPGDVKPTEQPPEPQDEAGAGRGVRDIPASWGDLPNNATLQVEIAWVQAQRLRVVEERGTYTDIHLDRASEPAPSMAALAWLETSCRNFSKYTDIVARSLATTDDTEAVERRERTAIGEIDALLSAMVGVGG